ncbi:hypothetical protein [Lacrimispora sp. JR3]|uniref:hypothetical protein n=1 Tax=Lacrimispora sinapis TaxID=3111456 RepID=UPI003748F95F
MSAFLGPIHIWLYHKIQFQDAMTDVILDLAEDKGFGELREKTDSRYGKLPEGNLEDLVDTGNIHGWLQEKVSLVENRLAYAVTELLAKIPDSLPLMEEAICQLGQSNPVESGSSAKAAFDYLDSKLLNGMPCDHVNELVENSEDKLVWRQAQDIHGAYWSMIHGDVKHYYTLRESLMKGMLDGSGIVLSQLEDQVYELRR